MLFCDVDMAARIERAECRLLADACANVARRLGSVFATPVGGGFAAFTEPGSPLNKVVGLGFAPFEELAWLAVEQEHAARGAAILVEVSTLADPAIAKHLTSRGFVLVGVENVLGQALPVVRLAAALPDVHVTASGAADLETWMDVLVTGFASPDAQGVGAHEQYDRAVIERIMRDFAAADGVTRYLAMRGSEPVGAASMRTGDGVAQLCGAATLPAHRRRGVQSALLTHRLAEAGRRGCTVAIVTTQPGSKSQQNAQRQGFAMLYARNVLRREPR